MTPSIKHRTKRNTRSKKHKQQLVDMPLDVLIEIFLFLEPLDLLHLARTTKGFRAFLLSRRKSSASWKNAISNCKDFPPCPDYMSAPAYTHLAFVPVCHGCFCPCETVEWELRMRCCPDCFPKMTIPQCSTLYNKTDSYLSDLDLPISRTHYKLDYDRGMDITISLGLVQPAPFFSLLDWKVAKSRKRPKNVESMKEFLAQQNDHWESIRRHARSCQAWEYRRLQVKASQLSLVRRRRVEDIKGRVKELGWTETDMSQCGYNLAQLPEVRKPKPLTPTEWTKIRHRVISWLQMVKEESACRYRMNAYDSAVLSVHRELISDTSLKVQPLMIDIATLPAVRSVVESNINSSMSNDDLKTKFFRVLLRAMRKWSSNAVDELEQFAREKLGLPPLLKPSCLPSVVFRCRVCRCGLRFDKALSHPHLYKVNSKQYKSSRKMSAYDKYIMGYDIHPRDLQVLRVDITVSRRVDNLVRRIGQNPSRVTYHELCHSTVRVVCGLCRPEVATRVNFARAFEHCLNTHLERKETEVWTRVPAREDCCNG